MLAASASLAIHSLLEHKLRAALSMLGTAIGIAGVLAMVTIGNGSAEKVRADLETLGTDLLTVQPGQSMRGGKGVRIAAADFDLADVEAIRRHVSGIRFAIPVASVPVLAVTRGGSWTAAVTGTTGEYLEARRWRLSDGRVFSEYETSIGRSVCILGAAVHRQLFGQEAAIGENVRLKSVSCEVIGVLEPRGLAGATVNDDNIIMMPISGFHRRVLGKADVHQVIVAGLPGVSNHRLEARVGGLMRERRGTQPSGETDFSVTDMKKAAATVLETSRTMTAMLAVIAALSLLVGGVGIMNVMLIAVQERTREIGVRLAIGATPGDVRWQFLLEAVLLALAGASVGILAGLTAGALGVAMLGLPMVADGTSVVIALLVSGFVGLASGYLPAARASRLDPIEALRHG